MLFIFNISLFLAFCLAIQLRLCKPYPIKCLNRRQLAGEIILIKNNEEKLR